MKLKGKRIAILIAPRGTEDSEFSEPKSATESEGAEVTVVGIEKGTAQTVKSDLDPAGNYDVTTTFEDVSPNQFDALIVPGGGVGSDKLRANNSAVCFVRDFVNEGKPVAVICHGPWLLVEAGVTEGRRLTSYKSIRTDIRNAGGHWVDEEVVIDGGIITSRSPDDLPAFIDSFIREVSA